MVTPQAASVLRPLASRDSAERWLSAVGAMSGAFLPGIVAVFGFAIGWLELAAATGFLALIGAVVGWMRARDAMEAMDPGTEVLKSTLASWLVGTTVLDVALVASSGAAQDLVANFMVLLPMAALTYIVGLGVALIGGLPCAIAGVVILRRIAGAWAE